MHPINSIDIGNAVDVRVLLFRIWKYEEWEISIDMEDLSEFEEENDDGTKLLNELSEGVSDWGDDIEAYTYNPEEGIVKYQCWEDGSLGEGCLYDPDDEDWQVLPNEEALKKLLSYGLTQSN